MKTVIGKGELVKQIAAKVGNVPKLQNIVGMVFDSIEENLVNGNEVAIKKFGNFKVIDRAERKEHNPRTGEEITIPARKLPAFKPSEALKTKVN